MAIMKNIVNLECALFLILSLILPLSLVSQEETGLPGDHFSLYGALEMFKESKDIEAFEQALNEENNFVNNLDLNEDGDIDYIRVEDHMEKGVHALVLQAVIGKKDMQDNPL